ncbi:DsbA family protein [Gordonia zhaorongruii]|uniref:DsbA family protein n=1 Tax=Gordonia zhaorongruii TaxID=2597659 RepID=UPI0010435EBD|nr:thioredoxin domain-containing protein [Gordonia zhaorongruii]
MTERRSTWPSWLVPSLIVIVAAALIGFVVVYNTGGTEPSASEADTSEVYPYDIGIERRDAHDPLAIGRVDAPITMVAFSDFQCPYCAKWSRDSLPAMLERVDRGQLRIEMRDLSVFGEPSRRAAEAAYAAAGQDRYLDFHNALFADGQKRPPNELTQDALVRTAAGLGLDVHRFRADMNSAETKAAVDRNEEDAATVGAYSTPSFILGGQPMAGAGPTKTYLDKLDSLLPVDGN